MDTTIIVAVAAAVLLLAGAAFLVWRSRARRAAQDEAVHHFLCPGCGRRLRFRAKQVGHKGQCSHCGKDLVFPPVSKSVS
jgi:transcription initiation factor IIE alpha subunit